ACTHRSPRWQLAGIQPTLRAPIHLVLDPTRYAQMGRHERHRDLFKNVRYSPLAPGAALAAAQSSFDLIARRLHDAHPWRRCRFLRAPDDGRGSDAAHLLRERRESAAGACSGEEARASVRLALGAEPAGIYR